MPAAARPSTSTRRAPSKGARLGSPGDRFEACAPSTALCLEWGAWGSLNDAVPAVAAAAAEAGLPPRPETFRYDVVNTAREVLAQVRKPPSWPRSWANFSL